jgi:hypothetical protein
MRCNCCIVFVQEGVVSTACQIISKCKVAVSSNAYCVLFAGLKAKEQHMRELVALAEQREASCKSEIGQLLASRSAMFESSKAAAAVAAAAAAAAAEAAAAAAAGPHSAEEDMDAVNARIEAAEKRMDAAQVRGYLGKTKQHRHVSERLTECAWLVAQGLISKRLYFKSLYRFSAYGH